LNAWRGGAERTEVAGTSAAFIALWSRQAWQACSPQHHRKPSVARAGVHCSLLLSKPVSSSVDGYKLSDPACPLRIDGRLSIGDCCLRSPRFFHKGGLLPVLQTSCRTFVGSPQYADTTASPVHYMAVSPHRGVM